MEKTGEESAQENREAEREQVTREANALFLGD